MGYREVPMGYREVPMGYREAPMGYREVPMGYGEVNCDRIEREFPSKCLLGPGWQNAFPFRFV